MKPTLRPELDELVRLLHEENVGMPDLKWRDNQRAISSAVRKFLDTGNVVTNLELRVLIERLYSTPEYSDTRRQCFWGSSRRPLPDFTNPANPDLFRLPHSTLHEAARKYFPGRYSLPASFEWGDGGVQASQQVIYFPSESSKALKRYLHKHFKASRIVYTFKNDA